MTRKNYVLKFLVAAVFVSVAVAFGSPVLMAQVRADAFPYQGQGNAYQYPLIDDVSEDARNNVPLPARASTMTGDMIPPFAAHPQLEPVSSPADVSVDDISFEENIPVTSKSDVAVDDFCDELTEMIAGNLTDDVSLETKKKMIEMALKMVARSVTLKSESKISDLKSEHQIEKARYQSQLMGMRIQYQGFADNQSQLAHAQRLEQIRRQMEVRSAYENKVAQEQLAKAQQQTIRLTSPTQHDPVHNRIDQLSEQIAALQQQLEERSSRSSVRTASYVEPSHARYTEPSHARYTEPSHARHAEPAQTRYVEPLQPQYRPTRLQPSQSKPQPLRPMHRTHSEQWTR